MFEILIIFPTSTYIRYVELLHRVWSTNSFAHFYGEKPYNSEMNPSENMMVTYFSMGEGYHNYHHAFPTDYSASEFSWVDKFNLNTMLIDVAHFFNMAWGNE